MNDADLDPRLGIGGNWPPSFAEELIDETRELAKQAHELIVCADERSEIVDDESAAKATQLAAMMRECAATLEIQRQSKKEPFLEQGRVVDRHYHAIALPLIGSDAKKLGGALGDLMARIDAWRRQREAEAAAERQRLEDEARKQREAAIEAERQRLAALERARNAKDPAVQQAEEEAATRAAETQRRAQDEAARREAQAEASVPRPIDSGVGPKIATRTKWRLEIYDYEVALRYALTLDRPGFHALTDTIFERQIRAGVRELPGAHVIEDSQSVLRRK